MNPQELLDGILNDYEPADTVFPIAYKGKPVMKANLVLEGGGMRCMFTAGVLDYFMDRGLFFENVFGVSAGALMGYNYVAGLQGRACYINLKYCADWRYLSLRSFVQTGNALCREMAFDAIPNVLDRFPYEAFNDSPMTLTTVASDLVTGEADYHTFTDAKADVPYLIASSSLPLVSETVEVDGKLLLDGGTTDSVPIIHSMLTGVKKQVVICTQDAGYVKPADRLIPMEGVRYGDYPEYVERLEHRPYEYNRLMRNLDRMAENGEIFLIRPDRPVTLSTMERNQSKLLDLYEEGVAVAAHEFDALLEYLGRPEE